MYDKLTWFFVKYFALKRGLSNFKSSDSPTLNESFLRNRFVELISRDINLRETYGKNRHYVIDNINIRMKLPLGSSYCLSGLLIRGLDDLCKELNLYNPIRMVGSTQKWFDLCMGPYMSLNFNSPKKADICILQKLSNTSAGHAYALTEDAGLDSPVHKTAEYNTNKLGSDDGEGFYFLSRNWNDFKTMRYRGSVDVIKWVMEVNNL